MTAQMMARGFPGATVRAQVDRSAFCSATVSCWPDSAVSRIRWARQLSGDKLPSLGLARDG
jgi:hypothetical protein